jgi:hypothetical protein
MPEQPNIPLVDAIGHIRRQPQMYLRDGIARSEDLVERMLSDVVWLDALPATAERVGSWSILSSEKEWLIDFTGAASTVTESAVVSPMRKSGSDEMPRRRRQRIVVAAADRVLQAASPIPAFPRERLRRSRIFRRPRESGGPCGDADLRSR